MQSRATWLFLIRFLLTAIKSKCMYIIIKKRKLELSIFIKLFPPPTNMNRVLLINNRSKLSLIKSRLMQRRSAAKKIPPSHRIEFDYRKSDFNFPPYWQGSILSQNLILTIHMNVNSAIVNFANDLILYLSQCEFTCLTYGSISTLW